MFAHSVVAAANPDLLPERDTLVVVGSVIGDHGDEGWLPVPGAVIKLKGTAKEVITDADGKFVIDLTEYNATMDTLTLSIGFIGYEWKDIEISSRGIVDIEMVRLEADLNAATGCGDGRVSIFRRMWFAIGSIFNKDF